MLISVVVIFYNQAVYVKRALESVIGQTHRELEIIVVDDGSDNSIEQQVKGLGDDRIRFVRKENGGAGSARNRGVQEAKGDYIAFLDGDDVWLPRKIEQTVDVLRRKDFPECIVSCGSFSVNNRGSVFNRTMPLDYAAGAVINTSHVRPSCTLYHKAVFNKLGGFPEHMKSNEDGAFNSVAAGRFPVYSTGDYGVLYRVDESGLARKYLDEFQPAVDVMQQRLDYISERLELKLAEDYALKSYSDLLFAFLSSGNLAAAVKYNKECHPALRCGPVGKMLARLSLLTRLNLYAAVLNIVSTVSIVRFRALTAQYREMLAL